MADVCFDNCMGNQSTYFFPPGALERIYRARTLFSPSFVARVRLRGAAR